MYVAYQSSPHSPLSLLFFQLIIQDITNSLGSDPKLRKKKNSLKVLLSDFENQKLALFAKRCAQVATCLITMCPEDPLFSWPTFTEEIEVLVKEGRCPDFVASLEQINSDPESRDKLVRFVSDNSKYPHVYDFILTHPCLDQMNYGCCALRLDLGKEVCIRTVQFYDIPGTRSAPEIVSLSLC